MSELGGVAGGLQMLGTVEKIGGGVPNLRAWHQGAGGLGRTLLASGGRGFKRVPKALERGLLGGLVREWHF